MWAVALLVASALISFRSMYEPDLWWHLAQGREVASGHLVRTNLFSFIYRDYPQHYTSWLFDLGAYVLWTRGGAAALQAVQAVLLAATLGTIALACRLRATTAATIAVCSFGWIILEPRALPRPHVFSFFGFAVCVYLIERARQAQSWKPLAWAPPVIAIWANVHVECVFGVAAIGLFGFCEWLRPGDLSRRDATKALAVAGVALLATAANPYGFGLLRYMFENTFVPQVLNIAELQPPYLPNYRGFFAWTIIGGLLLVSQWRKPALSDVALIALFGVMGFRYLRLTPMLFLASAPIVARFIDGLARFGIDRRAAAATALVAVLIMSRVPVTSLVKDLRVGRDALTPPGLFSEPGMLYAREKGLSGPAFTSMNLGGFVAWELYPSTLVFVDSRLQAYPPSHFRAIMDASRDPHAWDGLTAGVEWAVLSVPRANELSGVGRFNPPEWGTAYRDQAIEIVVRRTGPYGPLARPF
jgi:hypothetical protein